MQDFLILEKEVGQTPLQCLELWRSQHKAYANSPLAYAGRLDPMASGKLLVLVGEECKKQENYHRLDKKYRVEVLFGVSSDTGDVLGLISTQHHDPVTKNSLRKICQNLAGEIKLPYPSYSSKTVQGKPLHTWALEGRLHEIKIPTKTSIVYSLDLVSLRTLTKENVYQYATQKIETIPPVTEISKALGNDFRRPDIRKSWREFMDSTDTPEKFTIATFECIASSGTYMRTLAEVIASKLNTTGLAYSIHRSEIGVRKKLPFGFSYWQKRY